MRVYTCCFLLEKNAESFVAPLLEEASTSYVVRYLSLVSRRVGKIRRIEDYINIDNELDSLDLILCYGFSRKADAFVWQRAASELAAFCGGRGTRRWGLLFDDLIDSRNLAWNAPKMARPSASRTAEWGGFDVSNDRGIVKFDRIEIWLKFESENRVKFRNFVVNIDVFFDIERNNNRRM